MEWKDSSVTLPIPKQNELTNLIAQNGRKLELPAKKIFLEPGDKLKGSTTSRRAAPGTI